MENIIKQAKNIIGLIAVDSEITTEEFTTLNAKLESFIEEYEKIMEKSKCIIKKKQK